MSVCPLPSTPPPKHIEPALKLTTAQASGLNKRHLREKGNARQDEEWVSSGPGQLSSACLNHGAPLRDSVWFIRTSATGNETSNRCSAGQPGWAAVKEETTPSSPRDFSGYPPLGGRQSPLPESVRCRHPDREGTKILGINSCGLDIKGNRIHLRDCN